jgi:hypothetical protein
MNFYTHQGFPLMKTLARTIACFLWLFLLLGCAGKSLRAESGFEEGKYEVIDTGLEQSTLYGPDTLGSWLDNQRIVINALRDAPRAREDWLLKLVIFDIKTKKSTVLKEGVHLYCRRPKNGKAVLVADGHEPGSNIDRFSTKQFFKLDEHGDLSPWSDNPLVDGLECWPPLHSKPERISWRLENDDGSYIDTGKKGGGRSVENAILYRPGQAPKEFPVKGSEIFKPRYYPHLRQYLLNHWDNISGGHDQAGDPVFRLMKPNGEITEIPQSQQFLTTVGSFGDVWLSRDGMVLNRTGPGQRNPGLYFLKSNRIIRIWGANGYVATRFQRSPDGCTLAFLGFKNFDFVTKKTVQLINLCEGTQQWL